MGCGESLGMGAASSGGPAARSAAASESETFQLPSGFCNARMFHSIERFNQPLPVMFPEHIALNSATSRGNVTPVGITHGSCAAS